MMSPRFITVSAEERKAEYARIYSTYAGEVQAIQDKAGSYERDLTPIYAEKWQEMKNIMSECPIAAEITQMFVEAGYDMDEFERMYGAEKIRDAMFYGKDLKDRYSVLWPYYALIKK